MKKKTIIFALCGVICATSACSKSQVAEGTFKSGQSYRVVIKESKLKEPKATDGSHWGTDDYSMPSIIDEFSLLIDQESYFIPSKAFSDLCCITQITVSETNSLPLIKIKGGDAAGSYRATFHFNSRKRLEKRIVTSSTAPDIIWEVSEYHNNPYHIK